MTLFGLGSRRSTRHLCQPHHAANQRNAVSAMLRAILALVLILPIIAPAADTFTEDIYRDQHPIEDGAEVDQDRYPFVVRITTETGRCTGSLIRAGWVLTAAHCLDDADPAHVTVEHLHSKRQVRRVRRIVIHSEYEKTILTTPTTPSRAGVNDAALLAIDGHFEFPAAPVRVITPEEEQSIKNPEGFPAFILGYGRLNRGEGAPSPSRPHGVRQLIRFPDDCRARFPGLPLSWIHDRVLCVGYVKNVGGMRAGDSGGPLVIQIDGATALVGIASIWQPRFYSAPALYTRAALVQHWIESHTAADPGKPAAPRVSHVLTHVFAGPLANSTARTEITITNRDAYPCSATLRFHQGTAEAPRVRFNGRHLDNNTLEINFPPDDSPYAHGSQKITLTGDAGQDLAVGAVYIESAPDCEPEALHVEGRYLITRKDGEIMEAFSIPPQTPANWLTASGHCRILAADFGPNSNVGLAFVTAEPDKPAPPETRLTVQMWDWQGNDLGPLPALKVSGKHHALNPWTFNEPRSLRVCLQAPGKTGFNFRLSMIAIAATTSSRNVQYSAQALILDGSEAQRRAARCNTPPKP